jgi:formylglycine-generating enzyme required for sulfatase activity
LTLITVDDPTLDRVIEVSDTEITMGTYLRFRPGAVFSREDSPDDSCPINAITYFDAAEFCNELSRREGYGGEACYRSPGIDSEPVQPVIGHEIRQGFRLPTNQEFDAFCAARTTTKRYYGDSDLLLGRYAWILENSGGRTHPVASLIPNEFGLFDTLGNLHEWCERNSPRNSEGRMRADLRGGWCNWAPSTEVERATAVKRVPGEHADPTQGFRVVRTKSARLHRR